MSLPTDETQEIAAALPTATRQDNNTAVEAADYLRARVTATRRLSAKAAPFRSTGVARIRVTVAGDAQIFEVPIRSVPVIKERELRARTIESVMPPDAGSTLDQDTMRYVKVYDEQNPTYLRQIIEQTNLFVRLYVLEGLDCEVEDSAGAVVWVPGDPGRSDHNAALAALEEMGWTGEQIQVLREAIAELTMTREQVEERERRKKS